MPHPVAPGPRLAYDKDGTAVLFRNEHMGQVYDFVPAAVARMNAERGGGIVIPNAAVPGGWRTHVLMVFPVPIRLQGFYQMYGQFGGPSSDGALIAGWLETSVNSTNGVDGDWVRVLSNMPSDSPIVAVNSGEGAPEYQGLSAYDGGVYNLGFGGYSSGYVLPINDWYRRSRAMAPGGGWSALVGAGTRNVRALRWAGRLLSGSGGISGSPSYVFPTNDRLVMHLYGQPDTLATSSRVAIWQAANDLPLDPDGLDWGDVPLSSSRDQSFRLKNMSTTETALSTTVTVESSDPIATPSPTMVAMNLLSLDGMLWQTQVEIPTLAPGAVSAPIQMRLIAPGNAQLSNWAVRLVAQPGSWV